MRQLPLALMVAAAIVALFVQEVQAVALPIMRGSWNRLPQKNGMLKSLPLARQIRNETILHDEDEEGDVAVVAISSSSSSSSTKMTYIQTMCAGAVSRTAAQIVMHPANTYKTLLQVRGRKALPKLTSDTIWRGADAQLVLSLPHGAFYFAVIDEVKKRITSYLPQRLQFLGDFASSTISTVICSIVSTPQMVLTDRLMAGVYPSFPAAVKKIMASEGPRGFYSGWWPALAQKIPSYGLTWMFFQQLKRAYEDYMGTAPNSEASFVIGAAAAAASVCVMIPLDTIKTRLVTQMATPGAYKGMRDCFYRVMQEEGLGAFYNSLPPRLASVVPMIAIQFCIYETLKVQFERINYEKRLGQLRRIAANRAKAINRGVRKVGSRVRMRRARTQKEDIGESPADEDTSAFTRLHRRRRRELRMFPASDGQGSIQEDRLRDSKRHSTPNRVTRRVKVKAVDIPPPVTGPGPRLPQAPEMPINGRSLPVPSMK